MIVAPACATATAGFAGHRFRRKCGLCTHDRRRSNPGAYRVDGALLDGWRPFDFAGVPVNGAVRHPSDGGAAGRPLYAPGVKGEAGVIPGRGSGG